MKWISIIVALLISCQCFAQHKITFTTTYDGHKSIYKLYIPQNYKLTQGKDDNGNIEKVAHFKDGSVIYITDDLKGGGSFYDYKIEKYGNHYPLNNYITKDTATLYGIHNGKYWKEKKYYNIVAGYYNVSADEMRNYTKVIDDLIIQVDKTRKTAGHKF